MSDYVQDALEAWKRIRSAKSFAAAPSEVKSELRSAVQPGAHSMNPKLIDTVDNLKAWLLSLQERQLDLLTIDIETSGLNYARDHICGIALGCCDENVYVAIGHEAGRNIEKSEARILLEPLLSSRIPKLGHNITFDIAFLLIEGFRVAPPYYDTRLMAKEIHARDQKVKYGLKDLACLHIDPLANSWDKELEAVLRARFRSRDKVNLWRLPASEVCAYACSDVYLTRRLFQLYLDKIRKSDESKNYLGLERKVTECAVQMSAAGIKIDEARLESWIASAKARIADIDCALDAEVGMSGINYNSAKQVLPLLQVRDLSPTNPKTGKPSICLEALEGLNDPPPLVQLLTERTRIANQLKQLGGVPTFMRHGRVFPHIRVSANTGERFSATTPALFTGKRKPEPGEATLRSFVTPNANHVLLFLDIQSSHFRIMAKLSGDENMAAIFREGKDFHCASAALLYNLEYDDPKTKGLRDKAKPIGFSVVYGGGASGIASKLGISRTEAAMLKKRYLYAVFPKLGPYLDRMTQQAMSLGYVRSGVFGVKIAVPTDRAYVAINYQLQATEAELLKQIIVACSTFLHRYRSSVALTFHDEVVFQIHRSEIGLIPELRKMVENAEPRIPLVTDAAVSETTWGDKIPYDAWIKQQNV